MSVPADRGALTAADSIVVLLLSCDKYADLWEPATTLLNRYWTNCPFQRYIGSESAQGVNGFLPLSAGPGPVDWSTLLDRLLAQIETPYVLLLLDDFFLTGRVDTAAVLDLFNVMRRERAAHLLLRPHPEYLRRFRDAASVLEHVPGLPYRACLQAGFWDVSVLRSLLRSGESPWQFEFAATLRSDERPELFLAAAECPVPYVDVLERGVWLPRGVQLCQRERLPIDTTARPVLTYAGRARRVVSAACAGVINRAPRTMRAAVRRWRHSPAR